MRATTERSATFSRMKQGAARSYAASKTGRWKCQENKTHTQGLLPERPHQISEGEQAGLNFQGKKKPKGKGKRAALKKVSEGKGEKDGISRSESKPKIVTH